jgi:hypothetical protein
MVLGLSLTHVADMKIWDKSHNELHQSIYPPKLYVVSVTIHIY